MPRRPVKRSPRSPAPEGAAELRSTVRDPGREAAEGPAARASATTVPTMQAAAARRRSQAATSAPSPRAQDAWRRRKAHHHGDVDGHGGDALGGGRRFSLDGQDERIDGHLGMHGLVRAHGGHSRRRGPGESSRTLRAATRGEFSTDNSLIGRRNGRRLLLDGQGLAPWGISGHKSEKGERDEIRHGSGDAHRSDEADVGIQRRPGRAS